MPAEPGDEEIHQQTVPARQILALRHAQAETISAGDVPGQQRHEPPFADMLVTE